MHKHEAQRYTRLSQSTAQSSNLQTAHARVGKGAALEQVSKMACASALTMVVLSVFSLDSGVCLACPLTKGTFLLNRDTHSISTRARELPCFMRLVAARRVHMAGETNARHRVVPTCHAVGWVAPLVHVADSHGSGWSRSTAVTFALNQSCVCDPACLLTKGNLSELQDLPDID